MTDQKKRKRKERSQHVPDVTAAANSSHNDANYPSLDALDLGGVATPSLTSDSPSTEPIPLVASMTNSIVNRPRRPRTNTPSLSAASEQRSNTSALTDSRRMSGWDLKMYLDFYGHEPTRCRVTEYPVSENAHILAYGFKEIRDVKVR